MLIFWLSSFSCVRRISAEAWSLNGKTTRTGSGLLFSVGEGTGCSVALMAIKRVMVEFISSVIWVFKTGEQQRETIAFFREVGPVRRKSKCTIQHSFQWAAFIPIVNMTLVV